MKRLPTHSLTFRLSALMFLAMVFLLISGSVLMYFFVSLRAERFTIQALHNQLMTINDIIQSDNSSTLQKETFWEPQQYKLQYLDKITNLQGQVISASPDIDNEIPLTAWPNPSVDATPSLVKMVNIAGKKYALLAGISKPNIDGQSFKVYLAYNLARDQMMLRNFTYDLLGIVIGGLFFSVLVSFILIRIGLRPLSRFIKRIETITPTTIQPLETSDTHAELMPLISSINQLLARIKAGYQRLADFSSNIAHELRTPINNLMLETELLLSEPAINPKTQALLSSNLEEYQRLAHITEKLLFLARSDAKKLHLHKKSIDAHLEIQSIIEYQEIAAAERNIKITFEGQATILADRTLFRSAVTNLLANAIKYSNPDSTISICITETAQEFRIAITDTGPGIPNNHLHRITERFYRVDTDRASHTGGTGLGLAIVQTIMETHQGRLEFTANTPNGLIATLIFPKSNEVECS